MEKSVCKPALQHERHLLPLSVSLTGTAVFIFVAGRTDEFASAGLAWNKVNKDGASGGKANRWTHVFAALT